ncbi:MAG: urea transporter [Betaproteobacteria bacterium]|nr:urea transporter [Betaproteobacteria bacterium]
MRQHFIQLSEEIARGYAWVSLLPSWKAGVFLMLLTFLEPRMGISGLVGALFAWYAGMIAGADTGERPVCVFNGLLTGLFVAHTWTIGVSVMALVMLGGVFSGWLPVVFGRLAWAMVRLPILSLPFAQVSILTAAAGESLSTLHTVAYVAPPALFGTQIDRYFSAFGNLFFMPNPYIGLLILALLFIFSRYYILVSAFAYAAAMLWLNLLGAAPEYLAGTAWDSNAILAAILVGGLFATPSVISFMLAILAALIAAWLSLAFGRMLGVAHLLPFSIPFVMSAWLVLYAAVRNARMSNHFNLLLPDYPERTHERTSIARARIGNPESIPLALPFMGEWAVSQGFSGEHTHRGIWRHALDFIVMKQGKSFIKQGRDLEDFYCYNLPVLSPAYGQIWHTVNDVPDNLPGEVNIAANWGNYVLIRLHDGKFALVAHLKPGSISVYPGAWVKPGDLLGRCGNSGRSPQPHIHLHLQVTDLMGSPTFPFHLAGVLIAQHEADPPQFELASVPQASTFLKSATEGDVRPFYLLANRGMRYTVTHDNHLTVNWSLHCEIDLLGQFSLVSSTGGRCRVESTWAVFSCFERDEHTDLFLDMWLLACGYTPVSYQVERWQDLSPARLLLHGNAKYLTKLLWPLASFADSKFQRHWDENAQGWRQNGYHRQRLLGNQVCTEALISPQLGCTHLNATLNDLDYHFEVTGSFQRADIGVPAWEVPVHLSTTPRSIR